eukprot:gene14670-19708_t
MGHLSRSFSSITSKSSLNIPLMPVYEYDINHRNLGGGASNGDDAYPSVHYPLFGGLSMMHPLSGTISAILIIAFVLFIEHVFDVMKKSTIDTPFESMMAAIENELMTVGVMAFIFKLIFTNGISIDYEWYHALEYSDILVPIFAFCYCGIGLIQIYLSVRQCDAWSKAYHMKLMEVLDEFYDQSESMFFRLLPNAFNKNTSQLEFKIFHNIFCEMFKIQRHGLAFDEYVSRVYEKFVLNIIRIREWDWFLFVILLLLNLVRHKLKLYPYGSCHDNLDSSCVQHRDLMMFTTTGVVIFILTLVTLLYSRRLEMNVLARRGITCIRAYPIYLQHMEDHKDEEIELKRLNEEDLKKAVENAKAAPRTPAKFDMLTSNVTKLKGSVKNWIRQSMKKRSNQPVQVENEREKNPESISRRAKSGFINRIKSDGFHSIRHRNESENSVSVRNNNASRRRPRNAGTIVPTKSNDEIDSSMHGTGLNSTRNSEKQGVPFMDVSNKNNGFGISHSKYAEVDKVSGRIETSIFGAESATMIGKNDDNNIFQGYNNDNFYPQHRRSGSIIDHLPKIDDRSVDSEDSRLNNKITNLVADTSTTSNSNNINYFPEYNTVDIVELVDDEKHDRSSSVAPVKKNSLQSNDTLIADNESNAAEMIPSPSNNIHAVKLEPLAVSATSPLTRKSTFGIIPRRFSFGESLKSKEATEKLSSPNKLKRENTFQENDDVQSITEAEYGSNGDFTANKNNTKKVDTYNLLPNDMAKSSDNYDLEANSSTNKIDKSKSKSFDQPFAESMKSLIAYMFEKNDADANLYQKELINAQNSRQLAPNTEETDTSSENKVNSNSSTSESDKFSPPPFVPKSHSVLNMISSNVTIQNEPTERDLSLLIRNGEKGVQLEEHDDISDLFLFSWPNLYFELVQFLILTISLYFALWFTNFCIASPSYMNLVLSILPGILSVINFSFIIKSASLLKAIYQVDRDVLEEVLEQTEGSRQLGEQIRNKVLSSLELMGEPQAELYTLFQQVDENGENNLSRSQFATFMHSLGIYFSRKKWQQIFREIDRNFDDHISFEEFFLFLFPSHDMGLALEKRRVKIIGNRVRMKGEKYAEKHNRTKIKLLSHLTKSNHHAGEIHFVNKPRKSSMAEATREVRELREHRHQNRLQSDDNITSRIQRVLIGKSDNEIRT